MVVCDGFPKCDSYVGTHEDGEPLGRLANKKLRFWKKEAHSAFDKIWRDNHMDRDSAYGFLADELELPDEYVHIGMFNIQTCKKVVDISNKYLNDKTVENIRTFR